MIRLDAATVARLTGGEIIGGDPAKASERVSIDSRSIVPGDCFVAIVGPRDDGHRYAQRTLASGAAMLILQRQSIVEHLVNPTGAAIIRVTDTTAALQDLARHARDTVNPVVIAITGSVGKTTTKTLTHALIRATRKTHATPGNFNNRWGLPLSLLGLAADDVWMVAELGMSAAGEIGALTRLARPEIGVITNVSPVHMENFDSLGGVAAAKRELAEGLPPNGTLIVNADDPRTAAIGVEMSGRVAQGITFGRTAAADVAADGTRPADSGWHFDLRFPGQSPVAVHLPLPGEHSIANFLAAAAVAHALGIGSTTVAARAAALSLPPMRGQIHRTPAGVILLDDSYNASPAAMINALDTLASLPGNGRLILVAGDMLELGGWAEDAHREVGLHAAQLKYDQVFTVGVLARDIGHGACAGGLPAAAVHTFSSAEEAAAALCAAARQGDRVLVKGSRAVRMEQIVRTLLDAPADNGTED